MMHKKTILSFLLWTSANPFIKLLFLSLLYLPIYALLYKIYIPKITAFGCFDDCFNYVGGYFVNQGRHLYSDIYFNHQPLMAYISFLVQHVHPSINIFALILAHRQVLLAVSFLWSIFLSWRFGVVGFAFTLAYEFSKFYTFGDRFLAESFIVYPLVYLVGLGIRTVQKHTIARLEVIGAAVCTWFVVFMREPYIPLALFAFFVVIRPLWNKRTGIMAMVVFAVLTAILFTLFPAHDYFYNVITINSQRGLSTELSSNNFFGTGIFKSFFYFIYVLLNGYWGELRIIEIVASSIVILSSIFIIKTTKKIQLVLLLFITLGLANLRPTLPGKSYYEAFHMLVWYSLVLFSAFVLLRDLSVRTKKPYIFTAISILWIGYICFSPRSFIYQHTDEHTEYITNYGVYLQIGEVIRAVTTPDQTLFTDGADEFLYIASQRNSSYPYAFYYLADPGSRYYKARNTMFATHPPDIYYDFCTPQAPIHPSLPPAYIDQYTQFYSEGKPTCLFIKTSIATGLTPEQRQKVKDFRYDLPEKTTTQRPYQR